MDDWSIAAAAASPLGRRAAESEDAAVLEEEEERLPQLLMAAEASRRRCEGRRSEPTRRKECHLRIHLSFLSNTLSTSQKPAAGRAVMQTTSDRDRAVTCQ